jgi:cell division protein FtsW (lipid II flippase)
MPALILGVVTMRELGVRTSAWSMNLAAGAFGLLIFALIRYSAAPVSRFAWYVLTIGSMTAILSTFASDGLEGVYRWLSIGGFGLHASTIVAPIIIACVATAPSPHLAIATAAATAMLLALQPDAAQASSFAAGCSVILACDLRFGRRERIGGLVALIAGTIVALVRADPLKPVRYVEGIFEVVTARGPAWAMLATITLLLLPIPYFLSWAQHRQNLALALCTYVAMVTIAPTWGTFPVPIMGYGVSPILGYCIALALSARLTSTAPPLSGRALSSSA